MPRQIQVQVDEAAYVTKIQARTSEDFSRMETNEERQETMNVVRDVMEDAKWNQRATARTIGWPESTLRSRLNHYPRSGSVSKKPVAQRASRGQAERWIEEHPGEAMAHALSKKLGSTTQQAMNMVSILLSAQMKTEVVIEKLEATPKIPKDWKSSLLEAAKNYRSYSGRLATIAKGVSNV